MKWIYATLLFAIILLTRCANPIPPDGGPKDEQPPVLQLELSTPNFQTNFKPKEIILVFDEWIKLNNPLNQMLISPILEFPPQINLKGKEVKIIFNEKEVLRENTTYSIQFGESIQDVTESNSNEEMKFIFSTGAVLDSLRITGRVLNLDRNTPAVGVLVMLYTDFQDSIPLKERPSYTSKTNKSGGFIIENLRADTFKIFALKDENRNYLYEVGEESLAFLDELIILHDTSQIFEKLILFKEDLPFRISDHDLYKNKFVLKWDGQLSSKDVTIPNVKFAVEEWLKDSAILWLNEPIDSFEIFIDHTDGLDTLLIKKGRRIKRDTSLVKLDLSLMKKPILRTDDTLYLHFNQPLSSFDSTLISWSDTSDKKIEIKIQLIEPRKLSIVGKWEIGEVNKITLLPDAVTGQTGRKLKDTTSYSFFIPKKEKLGTIIFEGKSFEVGPQRLVQLLLGERLIKTITFTPDTTDQTLVIPYLRPGKYHIVTIEDDNENGMWDSGLYLKHRQPEKKWSQDLEPLRENWDLKVKLEFK